ncbi:RNA ligase RtcB family protein [Roseibium aggregatum]|uniref:3'-phosphate/5'-hydroxy nucleic acid ligase n=1 Tax=Roseibium aggregatum TaxID=187304 RepID=A0A939EGX6_9HYPH|nr:RNA ligase RtcB family protein [Roseibium aggregatum]MBN9671334.1 RNA ligase RtcB family protein [Roseibium aggregatum]
MGTFQIEGAEPVRHSAPIHRYYSKNSWIEGAAEDQLSLVAGMSGIASVAAFPDLHPGKYGPVGSAMMSDRIFPQLIGNDIGCGMSLFALDLPAHRLRLDKAAQKIRVLEEPWDGDAASRLKADDLPPDLHTASLGTIGGGNHFCELQQVEHISDEAALRDTGIARKSLLLLVHSGSRSFGMSVFGTVLEEFAGLDADSPKGRSYLEAHSGAARWASLNRRLIAERAASALRCDIQPVADAPHNLIEVKLDGLLHRKGAAKADLPLVPLAGSRDAFSYLLKPLAGKPEALASLAHGAGRKYDRRSMNGRAGTTRSDRENLARTSFGGLVICEDRQLLIEEAPNAYKDPAQVAGDLESAGLAAPVATLKPLLTFKKAVNDTLENARRDKRQRLADRRARR